MDYYRQSQSVSHAAPSAPQNYMYQQPTSAPSNSGMYYQQMNNYGQQASPYAMQPSVSQGNALVSQSGMSAVSGNGRRSRTSEASTPLHPTIARPISHEDSPLRMVVDAKYVGAIIGQQGNKIREITKESKARCIVDAPRGLRDAQGLAEKVILVYGPPDNASRAVVKILEVVELEKEKDRDRELAAGGDNADGEKSTDVELKLRAHNQLVGRLIGKQGSTIKKIMTETDTVVFVSKCDVATEAAHAALMPPMYAEILGSERTITVRAPSIAAVSAAEQRISAKLRQSYENDVNNRMVYASTTSTLPIMNPLAYDAAALAGIRPPLTSSFKTAKMYVPNNMVGAIIGSKGSHIRNIMRTSGAIIRIEGNDKQKDEKEKKDEAEEEKQEEEEKETKNETDEESDSDKKKETDESERLVTITGNDQQIYKAQYAIFAKVAEQQGHYLDEVKLRSEVNVPSRLVGRLIGKGGQNVRELQRLTGATVKIAEENNPENKKEEEKKEEKEEAEVDGEETTVRVTGNMTGTVGVEARIATLIADFSRNTINDRRNGASSAGP